jgi:hypothetical protein
LGAGLTPRSGADGDQIVDLPALIGSLAGEARELAERLYDVRRATARTDPPRELADWISARFGSVAAVREQELVRVTNRATLDAAVFAPLRARRPIDGSGGHDDDEARLRAEIAATEGDPFCHPETGTTADPFGRVHGRRMISGANAAKYEGHHGVLVFDEHDPTAFDAETVIDMLHTGRAWADRAHQADPAAVFYFLMWNSLWRAGGSIVHGHAQVMLGRHVHYGRIDRFRRDAVAWRERFGSGLVDELVSVHTDLGLCFALDDVTILASLTPIKERELWIVGRAGGDERDPTFADAVARTVLAYRDVLGVLAFNLALWRAPIASPPAAESWDDLPPIVRLVDRGDPERRASDIGAMELYAAPVVGSDPFSVVDELRSALRA